MASKRLALVAAIVLALAFGTAQTANAALSDITLLVNTVTGNVRLSINTPSTWWSGVDITSPSSQFIPGNLIPFSTSLPGNGFAIILSSSSIISQGTFGSVTSPVSLINMGNIFTPSGTQDIQLSWIDGSGFEYNAFGPGDTPPWGVVYEGGGPEIPEPASIAIWSLIGGTLLGARALRKRAMGAGVARSRWSPEARDAIHRIVERGRIR